MLKQAREVDDGLAWWLTPNAPAVALSVHGKAVGAPSAELAFFAPNFALSESQPWFVGQACDFPSYDQIPLPTLAHKVEPSSAAFARLHKEILAFIQSGLFEKVVPMVCTEFEFEEPLNRHMFKADPGPNQMAYGFQFGGEGLAGVTPEVLFECRDGILQTMALAGTGPTDGPSLLEDQKEMHEHRLVIEQIYSELKDYGEIELSETIERSYGLLKHLLTPITLKLNELPPFEELVTRLHPTAALGGWPRRPAVEWLEKQSFHVSRARFGAPFGFVQGERMMCVVAIRNVQWWGKRLQVSTGCGVVRESRVINEWKELELKRQAIFRSLGVEL